MSDPRIGQPGLHDGIDELEYHADTTTYSQSGIKLMLEAPFQFKWQLDHPSPPKRTMELGSAAHSVVLGVGAQPEAIHRYDPKTNEDLGEAEDMRSPSARDHAEAIRGRGNIPLLRKEIQQVEDMAESLSRHPFAMSILGEGRPEVTGYAVHEETGLNRRVRVDHLHPTVVGDIKTADTANPDVFLRRAADLGYYIQAPYYLDVLREHGHPAKAFAFIVMDKTPPYPVSVIQLGSASIKYGRRRYREGLQMLRDCLDSDLWPEYVDPETYVKRDIPDWAFSR